MMKASPNVPDRKAGVTPKRFRIRFPLSSFAPIAVEVREVEPIEVVRRTGRIAIHVAPEVATRIRNGDRDARLDLLRVLGRRLLYALPLHKIFGPPEMPRRERIAYAQARATDEVDRFARGVLEAASQGRDALVKRLRAHVDSRRGNAYWVTGDGSDEDLTRDARYLADVVFDLLRFETVEAS